MSKRNPGLPRKPRDLYQTSPDPVRGPVRFLLPHLGPATEFVEPCAAGGLLVDALTSAGHICVGASDIVPLREGIATADALQLDRVPPGAIVITNPPWSRNLLVPMAIRFSDLAPTWLIFDLDFLSTDVARVLLPRVRKIVAVGRVKWVFEGSRQSGFDNCCWTLLDKPNAAPAEFYGRGQLPMAAPKAARVCYDCRFVIGNRDRWRLAERNGVATTVHRDCARPQGQPAPPGPMPLFECSEVAA